ncbi:unnamed protein product [Linum trigynum]|uniref:Uncharacterized protein n=1 Tax=Linum trigynum TaxID=586398 RepID=A0AAV2E639_9ROSI
MLSKLTRQLSIHDNRAAAAAVSTMPNGSAESSPRTNGPPVGDDWRSAFDAAANGARTISCKRCTSSTLSHIVSSPQRQPLNVKVHKMVVVTSMSGGLRHGFR